jgi:probable F420-dependent oxidoreductase
VDVLLVCHRFEPPVRGTRPANLRELRCRAKGILALLAIEPLQGIGSALALPYDPAPPMKFSLSLAFSEPAYFCALARAAEAAGFALVALSDHVVHPRRLATKYPYTEDGGLRWEPFTPWPDVWVAVGAMAAVTERIGFTTSVFVLPLRNVFAVAKSVATAAAISGDRVSIGVGVGWMKEEFELLGQDFHTRGRRTDEMIDVLRKLWAGGWVEHHGRFYDFDELEMTPVPGREVPIYVGGLSDKALTRAATKGDGWCSDIHPLDEIRRIVAELRRRRADSERAGRPFEVLGACADAFDVDGYRRAEEAGVTCLMTMPWYFYGGGETLSGKIDAIRRFGDDIIGRMTA